LDRDHDTKVSKIIFRDKPFAVFIGRIFTGISVEYLFQAVCIFKKVVAVEIFNAYLGVAVSQGVLGKG